MKIEELEAFEPGSNPYRQDISRMGEFAGNNDAWHVMWDSWDRDMLVLVHKASGKRVRLIPDDSEWALLRDAALEDESANKVP